MLPQAGANSIRAHAGRVDKAERRGFTALAGLPPDNPRYGFDYADNSKVDQQCLKARDLVRTCRWQPARLFRSLAHEPEIPTTPGQLTAAAVKPLNELKR